LRQLVYFSTAAVHQDNGIIQAILEVSRLRNRRDSITGLLVAGGNRYLQVLEGSHSALDATLGRIKRDARHLGVSVLVDRTVREASFADWSMAFHGEPKLGEMSNFRSLADQLHDAADVRLREQIRCFSMTFASPPMQLAATLWPSADNDGGWVPN
jgi:hypothetical protein